MPSLKPCWSCDAQDEDCFEYCDCAKCKDPDAYQDWKDNNPDEYQDWLDDNTI